MKEIWKKSWKYLLILPIILVAVVVVVLTLPKDENTPLSVTAKDVVLEIGDSESIDYNVNIKQAVVSFDVEDETKANVNTSEKKIVGLSEGKTNLTVTAKYGNETSVVTVSVTVLEANSEPANPTFPEGNNPSENVPDIPTVTNDDIKVLVDNNEVDEITLSIGGSVTIKLESEDVNYKLKAGSEIEIVELPTNMFMLSATEQGQYTLTISTDNFFREIDVIVLS